VSKNLKLYGKDYDEYIELLSQGKVYSILISKRLLLRPMVPVWLYVFGLFLVRNGAFFAVVGLPSIIVYSVFLVMAFPLWEACHVSVRAYAVFHGACLFSLKILSIPISMLLEEVWIL